MLCSLVHIDGGFVMKRLLAFIFAAALLLSLAACGGAKDPDCGFEGFPTSLDDLCWRMQKYLDESLGKGKYELKVDNYPMVGETDQTIWFMNEQGKKLSPIVRPMVPNSWCELDTIRLHFYNGSPEEYLDHLGMALFRACDIDIAYEDAQTLIERMSDTLRSNSSDVLEETIDGYLVLFQKEPEYAGGYHINDPHVLTITPIE